MKPECAKIRDRQLVPVGQAALSFTPIGYELLKQLATNTGRVLTHRLLSARVWGPEYENEAKCLRTVVASLRKKLGSQLIQTEPGVGYRLLAPFRKSATVAGRAQAGSVPGSDELRHMKRWRASSRWQGIEKILSELPFALIPY